MTLRGCIVLALLIPFAPLPAQDTTAAIPQLGARVTRVRFFEGPRALPSPRDRQYAVRFDSASTRSVFVEIGLAYPPAPSAAALKIECGYTASSGAPAGTAVIEVATDPGWELSIHAGGTGSDTPGGWTPGNYKVACRFAGRTIASGSFDITRPAPAPVPPPAPAKPSKPAPSPPAGPVNDPNLKAPATLTGTPFGPLKARVTALRFFESGGEVPDRKDRVIASSFDALTTRFINIELELEYPRVAKTTSFEITCRFDGPDSTTRAPTIKGEVDPGWIGSYHMAGWGARNRGMWVEGSYKVTCLGDGKLLATSEFKVVKARAAVEALGASLTHIRFFQSLGERLPLETRRYGARFDGRTVRWIKTEFGLVYPPVPAPTTFSVECVYAFPDGSQRPVSVERRVPAAWTGSVHVQGIGSDRAGSWPAGFYKVTCKSEGHEFAAGSFEVTAGDPGPAQGGPLLFYSRLRGVRGAPPYAVGFEMGSFDSLFVEASLPLKTAGDSTMFRCGITDPAGVTSGFVFEGTVRDRNLTGSSPIATADPPRLRGDYRVECRIGSRGGVLLAERFTLTGPAELPALDARVVSTALYEGSDAPPDDEAVSDVTWSAAKMRSLWLIALLDHPSDKGVGTLTSACRLLTSKSVAIAGTGPGNTPVAPGDRALLLRKRLVLLPKQKWVPGKYTLLCTAGNAPFLRTTLDLTR